MQNILSGSSKSMSLKGYFLIYVTVQSQADLSKKSDECLHSRALFCINLFGGYASPRKHAVFSRLALNSYKNLYIRNIFAEKKQQENLLLLRIILNGQYTHESVPHRVQYIHITNQRHISHLFCFLNTSLCKSIFRKQVVMYFDIIKQSATSN